MNAALRARIRGKGRGSPEGLRGNRWAEGFEDPWDAWTKHQPRQGDPVEHTKSLHDLPVTTGGPS
jgi:hypothetical protein